MHHADHYTYMVEWSTEDECHIARALEFELLAAHGDSAEEALREIRSVVRAAIDELELAGDPVPSPLSEKKYSGKINLRMPSETHRRLAMEAAREHVSINQLINSRI